MRYIIKSKDTIFYIYNIFKKIIIYIILNKAF